MTEPISPALTPVPPAAAPPGVGSALKAKPSKPAKKSTVTSPGDQFADSYGAAKDGCQALIDPALHEADRLRNMKNLLFAPLHPGYHADAQKPDPIYGLGHALSTKEAGGYWYPLPLLARDSTKLSRPVVPFLHTSHDITEDDCPPVDYVDLVYVVYGNNEAWADGHLRTCMFDVPREYQSALSANVHKFNSVCAGWCCFNSIDYQTRYVLECMDGFGLEGNGWPAGGATCACRTPAALSTGLERQLVTYSGFAQCRLLVVDGLSEEDKKKLQQTPAVSQTLCQLASSCSEAYLHDAPVQRNVRSMAAGTWGNDPATLAKVRATHPHEVGKNIYDDSDTNSSDSSKRPRATAPPEKTGAKKARVEDGEDEDEMSLGGGSTSGSESDDDDEAEEEEEDDSEESDVDEEQESEDEGLKRKRVGTSAAKPTAKPPAKPPAKPTAKAATRPPLATSPSEGQEPVKKAGERGKRRPAMTRRSKLLEPGRGALQLLQQLSSVPTEFEKQLRENVLLTEKAVTEYVEEGHVEETSKLIGAYGRMTMSLAQLVTSMCNAGTPQPADSGASRRVAVQMSTLFETEQPVLEFFSTTLAELMDRRRKTVREAERAAAAIPLAGTVRAAA